MSHQLWLVPLVAFDPSWLVIRSLEAVGLLAIVGTPVRLDDDREHPGRPADDRAASRVVPGT